MLKWRKVDSMHLLAYPGMVDHSKYIAGPLLAAKVRDGSGYAGRAARWALFMREPRPSGGYSDKWRVLDYAPSLAAAQSRGDLLAEKGLRDLIEPAEKKNG